MWERERSFFLGTLCLRRTFSSASFNQMNRPTQLFQDMRFPWRIRLTTSMLWRLHHAVLLFESLLQLQDLLLLFWGQHPQLFRRKVHYLLKQCWLNIRGQKCLEKKIELCFQIKLPNYVELVCTWGAFYCSCNGLGTIELDAWPVWNGVVVLLSSTLIIFDGLSIDSWGPSLFILLP